MKKIATSNAIIINSQRSVLLVKRVKGADAGALWSLPGGTCQEGESKEDALLRETQEELGCPLSSFSFFRSFKMAIGRKIILAHYFLGRIDSPIILNKIELSEYDWFSEVDVPVDLAFNQNEVLCEFWESHPE